MSPYHGGYGSPCSKNTRPCRLPDTQQTLCGRRFVFSFCPLWSVSVPRWWAGRGDLTCPLKSLPPWLPVCREPWPLTWSCWLSLRTARRPQKLTGIASASGLLEGWQAPLLNGVLEKGVLLPWLAWLVACERPRGQGETAGPWVFNEGAWWGLGPATPHCRHCHVAVPGQSHSTGAELGQTQTFELAVGSSLTCVTEQLCDLSK